MVNDVSQEYSQTNILEKLKYSQYILKKIIIEFFINTVTVIVPKRSPK